MLITFKLIKTKIVYFDCFRNIFRIKIMQIKTKRKKMMKKMI